VACEALSYTTGPLGPLGLGRLPVDDMDNLSVRIKHDDKVTKFCLYGIQRKLSVFIRPTPVEVFISSLWFFLTKSLPVVAAKRHKSHALHSERFL